MKYNSVIILVVLGLSTNLFLQKVEARLKTEAILNGHVGEFKYQVAIMTKSGKICGGGILDDDLVLTAAHCVLDKKGKFLSELSYVIAGVTEVPDKKKVGVETEVERIYVPAEYKRAKIDELDYPTGDIAVLKLKTRLEVDKRKLTRLQLPASTPYPAPSYLLKKAIVAGFGYDQVLQVEGDNEVYLEKIHSNKQVKLRWGKTEIVSAAACAMRYNYEVSPKHICAIMIPRDDDKPVGTCDGDSGSPLVRNGDTVIGVVGSGNLRCDGPTLYTRLTSFLDFIHDARKGRKTPDMRLAISTKRKVIGIPVSGYYMKEV